MTQSLALYDSLIQAEPLLRTGSFANALEELSEAALFRHWLETRETLTFESLQQRLRFPFTPKEWIGGCLDLTGEIGRFAVARATKRDMSAVRSAASTLYEITELFANNYVVGGLFRDKQGALERTMQKIEKLLYEDSLLS